MTETLLSSTVLILAICAVRRLFRNRMNPGILYSLWGLAALRLMAVWIYPLVWLMDQLPPTRLSVMNAAEGFRERVISGTDFEPLVDNLATGHVYGFEQPVSLLKKAAGIDWQLVLFVLWALGFGCMVWLIVRSNSRFYKRLARERRVYAGELPPFVKQAVYLVPGLESPCYFRWKGETAIYLPEAAAEDKQAVRHMLAHESGHGIQRDLFWGGLRCILLCMYWFDPFVWLAAVRSKEDCELACDGMALRLLGEEERFAYGRTMVGLVPVKGAAKELLCTSTSMAAGKRALKERVRLLAGRPRTTAAGVLLLGAVLLVLGACTFTESPDAETDLPPVSETARASEGTGLETDQASPEGTDLDMAPEQGTEAEGTGNAPDNGDATAPEEPGQTPSGSLTLSSARQLGLFHSLILVWEDPLPAGMPERDDAHIQIMACQNPDGTSPMGDGGLVPGFSYQKEERGYRIEFWNVEQAASFLIRIEETNGRTAEYLYRPETLPEAVVSPMKQKIAGMKETGAVLESITEYPGTLVLTFTGETAGALSGFYETNVVLLDLEEEDGTIETMGPGAAVRASEETLQLFYCILDGGYAMKDVVSLRAGMGGQREEYAVTPLEYHEIFKAARDHVEAFMEKGELPRVASGEMKENLFVRWEPEEKEVYATASYRFVVPGEDSYTYLSMELKKAWGEWTVSFSGLEK